MPELLWSLVLLWNVLTLATFGWDKIRAKRQGRRVPERTLLWMVFATGWVGAWLAMSWFRHKTIKQPFRRYAIAWTVINPFWALLWWTWKNAGAA
ncbi:MAG: uncharacterized membrane protein YsdA (DUF1294 family) [Planctomycetota bacterium]|jgi:uncharacterized membrane protein YsdA (DUF1294 family)